MRVGSEKTQCGLDVSISRVFCSKRRYHDGELYLKLNLGVMFHFPSLKALDTFGNCQDRYYRWEYPIIVQEHNCENGLNWSSEWQENNTRKTPLLRKLVCVCFHMPNAAFGPEVF